MQHASETAFKQQGTRSKLRKNYNIAGWNDHVADYYAASKQALTQWHNAGKPLDGEIAMRRKKCRAEFKAALKRCQQQHDQIIMDKLATSMNSGHFSQFWNKTNKLM